MPLPDAPIVVNWQDSGTQRQSNVDTASFGQSVQTHVGGRSSFPNNFPTAPQSARPRGNKKMFIIAGGIAALLLLVFAGGAAIIGYNIIFTPKPTPKPGLTASADFNRIWVDYDVTENKKKGMQIHTNFTVHGMKDVDSYLAIYFETADGQRLRDKNKSYYSTAGEVAVYKELIIDYDPGTYDDLKIFMPYDELDLKEGKYNLKMSVDLIHKSGGVIQKLTTYDFVYTQPGR